MGGTRCQLGQVGKTLKQCHDEKQGRKGDWIKDMQRVVGMPGHESLKEGTRGVGGGVNINTNIFGNVRMILLLLCCPSS